MPAENLTIDRDSLAEVCRRYCIRRLSLFGSVVRDDFRPDSDVDVLVDFEAGRSLLDQVGFEQDLQTLLGCKVDVVVEGGISPYLEGRILQEAQPL